MKILCVNTAFAQAALALIDGQKKAFVRLDASAKSSEKVMPALDELLQNNQLDIADIDVIAVVIGPGSFTGVRIGVSLVKGFAAVFPRKKIVAISSLELMAFEYAQKNVKKTQFCAVQNALGGRFFVQEFDAEGVQISEPALVQQLSGIKKIGLDFERLDVDEYVGLDAKILADFALKKIGQSKFCDAKTLAPLYIRLSQAEEALQGKQNAEN